MEHILRVRERTISAPCRRWIVQKGIQSDVIRLDLDEEFASVASLVLFAAKGGEVTRLMVDGETLTVPASLIDGTGPVAFSLVGYDGEKRVITRAMEPTDCVYVVPCGPYDGSDPAPDEPDLLGQLTQAAQAAKDAASAASVAAGTATESAKGADNAADGAREAASGATDAAKKAEDAAQRADEAAQRADDAAQVAGEKSLYAYADPEADDRIIMEYPAFLESEDGGSIYLTLEGEDHA